MNHEKDPEQIEFEQKEKTVNKLWRHIQATDIPLARALVETGISLGEQTALELLQAHDIDQCEQCGMWASNWDGGELCSSCQKKAEVAQ